jgi:hypothetical protein
MFPSITGGMRSRIASVWWYGGLLVFVALSADSANATEVPLGKDVTLREANSSLGD